MKEYDSRIDTINHITNVQDKIELFVQLIRNRGKIHDASKLENPEKEVFDEVTPRLKDITFGSDEYKQSLEYMGSALEHHYNNNSHHPEHYQNGVDGMDLVDVVEMFMD